MTSAVKPTSRGSGTLFAALDTRRLVVAILFLLLFALAVRIPTDTDSFWHLRAGDYMLTTGRILQTDLFSLTRLNEAWVNHSWGAQIVMTLFTRVVGLNYGLSLYTALFAVAGMAFVYVTCEGNAYVRSFILVLTAATAAVFWSPRPQMFSFVFSAILLYVLDRYKRHKVDLLWWLVPMMILWVNLHGGFSIGFILLGGFIAGEILGRLFDRQNASLSWQQIGKVVLVTIVCAAVLVINPNTTQMWGYPFRTFEIGVLQQFIQEWGSPNFHGRETWPFIFMLVGILAAVGNSGKRLDWTDLALVSGTAFMSLYAGRNISTFALVAAPVLSRHLSAALEARGLRLGRPRPPRGFALTLNWALLIFIALGAGLKVIATLEPRTVAAAQADYLPVAAVKFLNDNKPAGPMFNTYNWGGYLMYAAPSYPVFVDGRTDLYDDELLTTWLNAINGKSWRETFAKWGIRLVVIEKDSTLAVLLREQSEWQEVYTDKMAAIFTLKSVAANIRR